MFTKKRLMTGLAVIALVIICAVSLVGCSGQKITAEEYIEIIKTENIDKIENYSTSFVVRTDKDTATVVNIVVNGTKVKYTHINGAIKKEELAKKKEADRDKYEEEVIYDLENKKTYTYSFKDKKYTATDGVKEFKLSDMLSEYLNYNFEDFEYSKGIYRNVTTEENIINTLEFKFSKNQFYYIANFIKEKDAKYNKSEFYLEVYKQTVKLPKAKQIA